MKQFKVYYPEMMLLSLLRSQQFIILALPKLIKKQNSSLKLAKKFEKEKFSKD